MTPVTVHVVPRRGVHRVTRDGVFHGDYVKARWANESAEELARTLRKQGRLVHIVMGEEQTQRV